MENKNLMIYNAVANVAARVFKLFAPEMFQPGKYDVPAVLGVLKRCKVFRDDDAETAANEIVKIEIDTFSCSFRAVDAFELLKRLGAAYSVPTACRAVFVKKADAAPVAVSFRVFAGLKDLCNRVGKDSLRPSLNYICVDTKRRALIVSDARTLSAVPVPEMFVSEDAKETYLITPAVLKSGKGILNISTDGTATNGADVCAVDEEIKYPNICRVLCRVPNQFITLGKKTLSEIKKHVAAAAKFGKVGTYQTPVILRAAAYANEIEIIGYRETADDETATNETRRVSVSLPQPAPFAFAVAVSAETINKVLSAEKMYLSESDAAVSFVDETRRVFTLLYPTKYISNTPWKNEYFNISLPQDAQTVDAVARTFEHAQDAPAAPFVDEETNDVPAVPAVSEEIKISYINKNYVPVINDEIKNAVAVAAEYKYIRYKLNSLGARVYRDHTPVVCAAELLLQRENLYIDNYALICGNGQTFAYIETANDEININYDVCPVDEETQMYNDYLAAAVSEDEETAPAVQDEETPAVSELGTDATETNDVPAVVSLPVATVPAVWYAVYNNVNSLHGVYFSKLLADDFLFNSLFTPGRSWNVLEINAPQDAPQTWPNAAAAVSVSEDEETAPAVQDEETPAVLIAYNFARRFRRVWQTAATVLFLIVCAAVPVSVSDSVPAVQETAPAVAVPVSELGTDEETAPETTNAAPADSVPAVAKKQPQTAKKRARRAVSFAAVPAVADSLANVPAVSDSLAVCFSDSVRADSVPAVSDSLPVCVADSVPADSLGAVADSLANVPAVSMDEETAPAVQDETAAPVSELGTDEETRPDVPAVVSEDEETPQDEETPAPADSVPAANSPAPAVPAVSGCPAPAVPAAVTPYVIGCVFIH